MQRVFVHLVPSLVGPRDLAGGIGVVIDVLRASTTICHALDAGAECVLPVLALEEARERRLSDPDVLLGGERGGRPIDGFDLGNGPTDYAPEGVGERRVVFTTTNGTRALLHCREAEQVVVACFANLAAVTSYLAERSEPVHVVCAGTDEAVTLEDCLCAGAIVYSLLKQCGAEPANDSARLALAAFEETSRSNLAEGVLACLTASRGGRNLASIGLESDVEVCARIDTTNVVPRFDAESGRITSAG